MTKIIEINDYDYGMVRRLGIPVIRSWTPERKVPAQKKRRVIKRGVPLSEYEHILLRVLRDMGGRAEAHVGSPLYRRLDRLLARTDDDRAIVSSGHERWWNSVAWKRQSLKDQGILARNSPQGIWELA